MTLYKYGGSLLKVGGSIAKDSACCCEQTINDCAEFDDFIAALGDVLWCASLSGVFTGTFPQGVGTADCDCADVNYEFCFDCGSGGGGGSLVGDCIAPGVSYSGINSGATLGFTCTESCVEVSATAIAGNCTVGGSTCINFPFTPSQFLGFSVSMTEVVGYTDCDGDYCQWTGGGTITFSGSPC